MQCDYLEIICNLQAIEKTKILIYKKLKISRHASMIIIRKLSVRVHWTRFPDTYELQDIVTQCMFLSCSCLDDVAYSV